MLEQLIGTQIIEEKTYCWSENRCITEGNPLVNLQLLLIKEEIILSLPNLKGSTENDAEWFPYHFPPLHSFAYPHQLAISNSSLSSLLSPFIGIRPKSGILPDSETFKKTNSN